MVAFFFPCSENLSLFLFCLLWGFVPNDRARCQQQMICKACSGACSAPQLLLQFWIAPAYAELAGLKPAECADHVAGIMSPWQLSQQILGNSFFLSSSGGGCSLPYTWIISGIFHSREWSVFKQKQHCGFHLSGFEPFLSIPGSTAWVRLHTAYSH